MKQLNDYSPFIFITGLFFLLICPHFLSEGMFMDGLLYANISHQLANGNGSFWNLYSDAVYSPEFHGHPPLAMGILSLFYKIFGDSILIEKIYSVSTYIIVGFLMILIWKELEFNTKRAWLPLLFWILSPLVIWGATNNLLENTMSIFVCLSVLFYLISIRKWHYGFVFISGIMVFLAFLSKGITGIYTFVFPFLYWIFAQKNKFIRMVADTLIMLLGFVLTAIILFSISETAYDSIIKYIDLQIVGSLENNWQTVNNRAFILWKFFLEQIPPLILLIGFLVVAWKKKILKSIKSQTLNYACLFFALGLSGVLPIMISLKQSGFYILTTFPFFAISFGIIANTIAEKIKINVKFKNIFNYISILFIALAIIGNCLFYNKIGRDKELLTDIHIILPYVPKDEIISIDKSMEYSWALRFYMVRYKNISSDTDSSHDLLLTNSKNISRKTDYQLVDTTTKTLFLYKPIHNQ